MDKEKTDFSIEGLSPARTAILARSKTYKLYLLNRRNLLEGRCPFCKRDEGEEVIARNDFWWAKVTPSPESNTALHLLVIPHDHVAGLMEMDSAAGAALFTLIRELYDKYSIDAAGLLTRDGNPIKLAGTVEHYHWHVMVPNGQGRVETPLAKGDNDEEVGRRRAVIFEALFQGTLTPDQFTPEQAELMEVSKGEKSRLKGYRAA